MANLLGFRSMLADKAAADKGLPGVCLRCSTDLDIALARLINVDNRREDESDSQVTTRYVDEICDSISSPENAEVADKLNAVIKAFYDKIKGTTNKINEIRASAKTLAETMEKAKTEYLAKDPYVSTHLNLVNVSLDYPTWEWSGLKLLGGTTYIQERIGGHLVSSGVEPPKEFNYRLFVNACETIGSKVSLSPVEISEESKEKLIDTIVDALGGDLSKEEVSSVVDVLTVARSINGVVLDMQRLVGMNPADLFERVKEYDQFICKYYPVTEAISDKRVVLEDSVKGIADNADKLRLLCEFMAYYEAMERETVFRQAILLQGGLLNADTKEEYASAGGTNVMIAHYLRYMYKDDASKIPARGISGKVIIESAAHNEKVVKADISNITNRIAIATTKARCDAFKVVAHRYFINKVDRDSPDATGGEKATAIEDYTMTIAKKIGQRILHHDISFVDAALMLIIESDYKGTFVEQMYNKLGTAYLAKINSVEGGNVSDADLQVAGMTVVSEMISSFVVDKLIDACQCKDMTVKAAISPATES